MTLHQIKELLKAETLAECSNQRIDIKVVKASDLMSDVLSYTGPGELLLTGLTNTHVIRTCEIAGVFAVVFVRGKKPPAETVKLATQCDIHLLATDLSMFESCGILFSRGLRGVSQSKTAQQ